MNSNSNNKLLKKSNELRHPVETERPVYTEGHVACVVRNWAKTQQR